LDEVINDLNFHSRLTSGDRTWVYCCDPETKQQSSQWKSILSKPEESEASQVKHQECVGDLVISFDCEDIVQQEFVSTGNIVNQYYFWKVLYHVRE
jgi:hypothetical protein